MNSPLPRSAPTFGKVPRDLAVVARASPKRRRAHLWGRAFAGRALATLGCFRGRILRSPGGAPVWPDGFCGSISHSGAVCAAVAAPTLVVASIGIDIEHACPLAPHLLDRVVASGDRTPSDHAVERGKLLFCVKEAVYKAVAPLCPRPPAFSEIVVAMAECSDAFTARVVTDLASSQRCHGRVRRVAGAIVAVAWPD